MTGMLASVNSLQEAQLALDAEVDIIDLKQPSKGALGALEIDLIITIVTAINGICPISATIGDLPMHPDSVFKAVDDMVNTGVDYVKIGFFPDGDWLATLQKLRSHTDLWQQQRTGLIAVLFADTQPDLTILNTLKNSGFKGVMLDTMDKQKGSLTQVMAPVTITQFVKLTRQHPLLCGLAGSLKVDDIAKLMPLNPDYLGFRGALCNQHNRTAQLNQSAVIKIKQAIKHATL
ncbi:MAG: (5-formylfuran-3-yl)methyl phosphate synthase [Methylococcaceae bacterium]|nr:(5-formylfuran-3-yl)methyl phosphate synthase [Methylococcaceae bacterium]